MKLTAAVRLAVVCAALAAACSTVRWSGSPPAGEPSSDELHPPPRAAGPEIEPPAISPSPRRSRIAPAPLPEPSVLKKETALFPSDLGPDSLDVSEYPLQQRYNYRIYSSACSRCHDLARSLWAPHTSGAWLDFYLTSMRVRGRLHGRPFTSSELKAVRDFLAYDARERKSAPRDAAYRAHLGQLEKSFDALMDERMDKLQRNALPAVK